MLFAVALWFRLTGRLVTEWMKDSETYHAVCQGFRNIDFTYPNCPATNKGQRITVTVMHNLMLYLVFQWFRSMTSVTDFRLPVYRSVYVLYISCTLASHIH